MPRRSWKEAWTRICAMGVDEIRTRALQECYKRTDLLRYRTGIASQGRPGSSGSLGRFFFESSDIPALVSTLRAELPQQVEAIIEEANAILAHRFRLLGYSDLAYGPSIDWQFDPVHQVRCPRKPWFQIDYFDPAEVGDPKVIWELNRLQHLVVLAKAYRLTDDNRFASEILEQWYCWRTENPYPVGINWSSSLEVAFRSMSSLWVLFLMRGGSDVPTAFTADVLQALSIGGRHIERYLSTYSSPNTHLLGEAVGLFFIGTLCPQLPSASRWQRRAWAIVLNEAKRQIRADGFHFEQSTYYQVYALDFFLHARMLAVRNGVIVPAWFDQTLEKMLHTLCLLSQAGPPPAFGDDDGGRVFDSRRNRREHLKDPLATGAVLFGRGDWKSACGGFLCEETVWLLGAEAARRFAKIACSPCALGPVALKGSGYYVMADSSRPGWQMVIDGGPQGVHSAGHGHADALSIHLSANGYELLCDPGAFEYGGNGEGRGWFRSTRAHNTMQVDGLDQAETKGPFAWTALPTTNVERWIVGKQYTVFRGDHSGYSRLTPPVTHERWVLNFKSACWIVLDVANGDGEHEIDVSWHFGPGVTVRSGAFLAEDGLTGLVLRGADANLWSEALCGEWWSPVYGIRSPTKTLHYRCKGKLPVELATLLVPAEQFSLSSDSFFAFGDRVGSAHGFCYATKSSRYGAIFAPPGQTWCLDGWTSDGDLLCYDLNGDGLQSLLLCNGSFVEWREQRILSGGHRVSWCEAIRSGSSFEVNSPLPDGCAEQNLSSSQGSPEPSSLDHRMNTIGVGR